MRPDTGLSSVQLAGACANDGTSWSNAVGDCTHAHIRPVSHRLMLSPKKQRVLS